MTAHDETLVCGPTLASAEAALAAARGAGHTTEAIIALDNATAATRDWFAHAAGPEWTQIEIAEGDLGLARNATLPRCKGRLIAFLDADDLFSENWLALGIARIDAETRRGRQVIAHPEINWLFDGAHSIFAKPDQSDRLFSPYHFYFMNYYDSLCMGPREAFEAHPYVSRDIPGGLSFQDWHFSIETMGAGWQHVSVADTIIFKRRRDDSLVAESRTRRALVRQLDPMAVDRIDGLGAGALAPARAGIATRARQMLRGSPRPGAPHSGPIFANRLDRAQKRRGHFPDNAVYKTVEAAFDHAFYLTQYPDILALENVDPVAHYLRAGAEEGRDPAPWFSTRAYLRRVPAAAEAEANPFHHYLTHAQGTPWIGAPFDDFEDMAAALDMPVADLWTEWRKRLDAIRDRFTHGALGAQVARAEQIEPIVGLGWGEVHQVKLPPLHSPEPVRRSAAMWRLVQASGQRRARFVICVNRARFGAAPRVEGHIARALASAHGADEVLVITTDKPGEMPDGKLPKGVRHVDFATLCPLLRGDTRQRALAEFLRALHPRAVFNVNSRLMWDMMTPYGTALGASMHIHASLLCNERNAAGHWTGYPLRRFYRHFEQLSGVVTDSAFLRDDLTTRHRLPPAQAARLHVLPNPVDPSIPLADPPKSGTRPQIFWAGRLDAQKRVDLIFAIARAMPEADFRLWGEAVMDGAPLPDAPANLTLEGSYARFTDLPLNDASAWAYTAAWDGVPSMLLEVAMTGVPLVGSDVGGTREVLRDGLATAMAPSASASDWATALRRTLADPDRARASALTLRDTLIAERTVQAHADVVLSLPGCAP